MPYNPRIKKTKGSEMIDFENAVAAYREFHPSGPEPSRIQSFPAQVFGKQEPNWHLFTENKEYIATIKNPESSHGRITYSGPKGKRDKHYVSVLNVESHSSS